MTPNATTRTKLMRAGAAVALMACTVLATAAPAAARPWGWHGGWHGGWHHGWGWGGAIAAGVIGGALAAATSPLWAPGYDYGYYYPGYAYGPAYAYEPGPGGGVAYCEAHFRSYNPATETYLGYDGEYHHCP